jgi:hypothetical protein
MYYIQLKTIKLLGKILSVKKAVRGFIEFLPSPELIHLLWDMGYAKAPFYMPLSDMCMETRREVQDTPQGASEDAD